MEKNKITETKTTNKWTIERPPAVITITLIQHLVLYYNDATPIRWREGGA